MNDLFFRGGGVKTMAAAPSAIVLGASIAGLATAISLRRHGFAVTVVEHAERGAPGGAGLALTHAASRRRGGRRPTPPAC